MPFPADSATTSQPPAGAIESTRSASNAREGSGPPDLSDLPETIISANAGAQFAQALRDLWAYRELFYAFMVRDIKVRYKQTALGIVWVVLQPLLTSVIFAVLFRQLGVNMSGGDKWGETLFFMAGLVPWTAFSLGVQNAALSTETNAALITKVYFPLMVSPGALVFAAGLDFVVSFVALLILAAATGYPVVSLVLVTPLLFAIMIVAGCGVGLFFGAYNAQYRDVKYVIPFVLRVGMMVTVLFSRESWPANWEFALALNPMAGVTETYRALLTGEGVPWALVGEGAAAAVVSLVGGLVVFRRREGRMVDVL